MVNMKVFVLALVTSGALAGKANNHLRFGKEMNKNHVGSMLMDIAKEFVQRSSSSSQVLNVNLSNLLLLLVLKAVIFSAQYLGHYGYRRRELQKENVVSEGEIVLALGFLMGDKCLYRAACEEPHIAKHYLGAAEMIAETMKLLPKEPPIEGKYEQMIEEFRKAIEYGIKNSCPSEYICKKENIKNLLTEK